MNLIKLINRSLPKRLQNNGGWIQAIWPALKAVGAFAGKNAGNIASIASMFGGGGGGDSETVNIEDSMPAWIKSLGTDFGSKIQQAISGYTPGQAYAGELSTGATDLEKMGLGDLNTYLQSSGTGELFDAAKTQVLDTLGGKYIDPSTSPYIQSMMKLSKTNLEDSINQARANAGGRGQYFHSKAIEEEGSITENVLNQLNALIGQFQQNERQNMLGSVDTATSMDKYINQDIPLSKIGASQTYGALERVLEQNDLNRQYDEWVRQQSEKSGALDKAGGLYSDMFGEIAEWSKPQESSMFEKILGSVPAIQSILGSFSKKK